MSPTLSRRALLAGAFILAAACAGRPLVAQAAGRAAAPAAADRLSGYEYAFVYASEDGDDDDDAPRRGVVRVARGQQRIELAPKREGRPADYILVTDGGATLTLVSPSKREYRTMRADEFEGIIGKALGMVRGIVSFDVEGLQVRGEKLGAGETVAGFATERYRLMHDYTVVVRAFGTRTPERRRVTTEYWVGQDLPLLRNPLVEFMVAAEHALAQTNRDFVRETTARRTALFDAAPLRVVLTAETTEEDGGTERDRAEFRVERLARASFDAAQFVVPAGYRRGEGLEVNF